MEKRVLDQGAPHRERSLGGMRIARPQLRELHRPHAPQAVQLLIVGGAHGGDVGKALGQTHGEAGLEIGKARGRRTDPLHVRCTHLNLPDPLRVHADDGTDRAQGHHFGAQGGDLDSARIADAGRIRRAWCAAWCA